MYHLINEVGNVCRTVDSAAKRDRLLAQGYTEVPLPAKAAKKADNGKKTGKKSGDAE